MPIKNELEEALGNSDARSVFFPANLDEIDHWMAFRINRSVLMKKDDFPIKNDIQRIFLPLPDNLATQYAHEYNSEGIGPAGLAGAQSGGAVFNALKGGDVAALGSVIGEVGGKDLLAAGQYYGLQAAQNDILAVVSASVGGITGAVAGVAAQQYLKGAIAGQGLALNPYMATMYDSPQFRTHSFTWKFVPKNINESRTLKNIIFFFKYYAAPGINGDNTHFFDYPEQFDIDFRYADYLFNIGPSVLKEFEVNYHGEGRALYHDAQSGGNRPELGDAETVKTPASIVINATFQEVAIVTKDTIREQGR